MVSSIEINAYNKTDQMKMTFNGRTIREISKMPTIKNNYHESSTRAFHILEAVKKMLARADSLDTILTVIQTMENED